MIYTIKAIPTIYNHVQFRSRLEARWAAFFDLAGIKWDYEPFDLDGWAPDFMLRWTGQNILVEVKPIDFHQPVSPEMEEAVAKAAAHAASCSVLILGLAPYADTSVGVSLCDCPLIRATASTALWRKAGNAVQWRQDDEPAGDYYTQLRRVFGRKAA